MFNLDPMGAGLLTKLTVSIWSEVTRSECHNLLSHTTILSVPCGPSNEELHFWNQLLCTQLQDAVQTVFTLATSSNSFIVKICHQEYFLFESNKLSEKIQVKITKSLTSKTFNSILWVSAQIYCLGRSALNVSTKIFCYSFSWLGGL